LGEPFYILAPCSKYSQTADLFASDQTKVTKFTISFGLTENRKSKRELGKLKQKLRELNGNYRNRLETSVEQRERAPRIMYK
jgi:hypothetical protein